MWLPVCVEGRLLWAIVWQLVASPRQRPSRNEHLNPLCLWHGLLGSADGMMKAAQQFIAGVQQIEGLEIVGAPEMSVVAFKATRAAAKRCETRGHINLVEGAVVTRSERCVATCAFQSLPVPLCHILQGPGHLQGERPAVQAGLAPQRAPGVRGAAAEHTRGMFTCFHWQHTSHVPQAACPLSRPLAVCAVRHLQLTQPTLPAPSLQRPAALHICITAAHSSGIIDLLLRDLRQAVATALQVGCPYVSNQSRLARLGESVLRFDGGMQCPAMDAAGCLIDRCG